MSLRLIATILFALTFFDCTNSHSQKKLSEEDQVKVMLKEFYTVYINAYEDFFKEQSGHPELLSTKVDSILNIYLSPKLYKYLNEVNNEGLVLDFDPLLNSQMIEKRMLEHMEFNKIENDLYLVRYTYGSSFVLVKLRVEKVGNGYKIAEAFIKDSKENERELTKDNWHN